MNPRFFAVCGTRPDAIKMAPVISELKKHSDIQTVVIASGQHREILQQVFHQFNIQADLNLEVMKHGQTLAEMTSNILQRFEAAFEEMKPDMVIAQGDTTTTFCAGLSAFYRKIPFAHVEAGLRTPTIDAPFPEEFNRRAVSLFAKLHFPPTRSAAINLLREGVPKDSVLITGNSSIDALLEITRGLPPTTPCDGRMMLVTTHRRENWGEPQKRICRAIHRILETYSDVQVVLPMHPNPIVRELLTDAFQHHPRVQLIEPPEYGPFANLMRSAYLILTDSGGIQEEAPALGKPVLVLREETERPEGIEAGNAVLVGTDENRIFEHASKLLSDQAYYAAMSNARNPYGDGKASLRIVARIRNYFGLPAETVSPFEPLP